MKKPMDNQRSPTWGKFKRAYAKKVPKVCSVCGAVKGKIELHHIVPFHLDKSKEEDDSNVIWLCENLSYGLNCHLAFGHLGNFKSWNENVMADARAWNKKIKNRPK